MHLAIDIGNTTTKLAILHSNKVIYKKTISQLSIEFIDSIIKNYPETNRCILSSVAKRNDKITEYLAKNIDLFIELKPGIKLPFKLNYKTLHTLGNDRIAAIAGANNIFPESNVLVIDIGTAITYDIIDNNNVYIGGNISPGLNLRYKSLHEHTSRLPLLEIHNEQALIGNSTSQAIISGVQNGVKYEIEGFINEIENKFNNLKILITGGHSDMFAKQIKSSIFVQPNLVLIGLNRILEYNAENH